MLASRNRACRMTRRFSIATFRRARGALGLKVGRDATIAAGKGLAPLAKHMKAQGGSEKNFLAR